MNIKPGDYIQAFLKESEKSKDFNGTEQAGREASPFNRRKAEEVISVQPRGKYQSQPCRVSTPFSNYDFRYWKITVVIPSFAKTTPPLPHNQRPVEVFRTEEKRQVWFYRVSGTRSPYKVQAMYSDDITDFDIVAEHTSPADARYHDIFSSA